MGSEPDLLLLRNTCGVTTEYDQETGQPRKIRYGLGVGSPDLVGILRSPSGHGVWVCFEVKSDDGPVSRDQRDCHRIWQKFGAYVLVVRSAQEAMIGLQAVRAELRAPGYAGMESET